MPVSQEIGDLACGDDGRDDQVELRVGILSEFSHDGICEDVVGELHGLGKLIYD